MPASPVVDMQNTYGALFIGLIFSTILYGVTIAQTYYRNRDRKALQGFVAFLLYLVVSFGNVENLGWSIWSMDSQTEVNTLVGLLVQLSVPSSALLLASCPNVEQLLCETIVYHEQQHRSPGNYLLGCYFTFKAVELKRYSRFGSLTWVTSVGMGSASLADIIIALSMCWCLWHKRTGFARTDSILMTLMSYSINSGLLTSFLATGMLISFVVRPTYLIYMAFFWMMGKCYVNSFLAMLNNRKSLRERSNDNHTADSLTMPSIRQSGRPYKSRSVPTAVAVTVHRAATTDFGFANDDYDQEVDTLKLKKSATAFLTSSPFLIVSQPTADGMVEEGNGSCFGIRMEYRNGSDASYGS
ncbi:hypothetical protein BC826DRAFT_1178134 [Russula brevipes]|nr:hypothetical protein BC826DRAFT_1178134 [Russula brevipes]